MSPFIFITDITYSSSLTYFHRNVCCTYEGVCSTHTVILDAKHSQSVQFSPTQTAHTILDSLNRKSLIHFQVYISIANNLKCKVVHAYYFQFSHGRHSGKWNHYTQIDMFSLCQCLYYRTCWHQLQAILLLAIIPLSPWLLHLMTLLFITIPLHFDKNIQSWSAEIKGFWGNWKCKYTALLLMNVSNSGSPWQPLIKCPH